MAEPSENPSTARARLENQAKKAFWKAFQAGVSELFQLAPQRWQGTDAVHYRAEKQMITRHVEPLYWGSCIALFVFVTFRISGSKWYSRFHSHFLRNKASTSVNNTTGTIAAQQKQTPAGEWKSYLSQKAEQQQEYHNELLDLPTDIFVSVMCGLSTIALLSDPAEIEKDAVRAPLLPGKSIIHEIMCPKMIKAFEDTFDERVFDGEVDRGVLNFAAMVSNCKARDAYIRRRENDTKRPDVVPYPGLRGQGQ
jgi:hypothetical protein